MALPDSLGTGEMSIDDITDLFASDDDKITKDKDEIKDTEEEIQVEDEESEDKDNKIKSKSKDKEEKEEIKLKDDEDKDIDIDEELKLIVPFRKKEILAKYPEIFKEFPYLEVSYFRDRQFTEIFPTVNDAKEAAEKIDVLDKWNGAINDGNLDGVLAAFKESGNKSFNKVINNYMTALSKASPDGYHHVIGNIIKHTIVGMVQEAKRSSNEDLQTAAQLLNQYVFGTSEFQGPSRLADGQDENPERDEIAKDRANFIRERFESTRDDLNIKVQNVLKATIDAHIDTRNSMTPYVKKHATSEALNSLESSIRQDANFIKILDNLWKRAFESKFNKNSMDKVRAAYLSKAKSLLPSVIRKARNDALSGLGKRTKIDDKDDVDNEERTSERKNTRTSSSSQEKKDAIPKGMSTVDFLLQD